MISNDKTDRGGDEQGASHTSHQSDRSDQPDPSDAREREDRIAAFVDGEMTPDEMAAFERRMRGDEALRRDVEQWRDAVEAARDWMDADVPGTERLAGLAIPSVANRVSRHSEPARVLDLRRLVRGAAAAAAIFVFGFYIGHVTQGRAPVPVGDSVVENPQPTPTIEKPAPPERQSPGPGREVAQARRYFTDERGRLLVETQLADSRGTAFFVIDRSFQLP